MHIAVLGDCTGHGVPGAVLVSMGISFLYQIIDSHDCELMPDTILTQLREKVISSFGVDTFSTTRATVPKPTTSPLLRLNCNDYLTSIVCTVVEKISTFAPN